MLARCATGLLAVIGATTILTTIAARDTQSGTVCLDLHREDLADCLNEAFRGQPNVNAIHTELLLHGYEIQTLSPVAIQYSQSPALLARPVSRSIFLSLDALAASPALIAPPEEGRTGPLFWR